MSAAVETMLDLDIPENPFPGLRPFEFNESLLYFGRDGQSEQLLRRLSATRLLAVVGTSGSGKSSLVRAGLLPALLGGFMSSAGSNWHIALMRPGFDPIGNLARALAAPEVLGSNGDQEILSAMAESTLRRGSLGLLDLAQQARISSSQNLLIVADQFEELFRVAGFAQSEAYQNHAAAFVKLLLEASRQRELPIYVVLTMRSDFLGDCSSFWGLPEAINEGQYLIPRLTREQRREAIAGPIAVCGGAITDRLVTRLLNDMGDDQDQLPLLQHALMRTWVKWKEPHAESPAIDLDHYESIGGMSDALSLHVDEAFNSLPDERSRHLAEKVFKGLTEKGPDNRELRRPVTFGALSVVTGAEESELAQVIDTFRQHERCFLMPPADVPLTSAAMIDISHESLIRNWRRLKGWVDEEARSARIYRRLAETAMLHREGKAGLWRDPDLQVALTWREQTRPNKEWAERYHLEFDGAIGFLDKSLAERGAEQREREAEARDKELRRSRQIRNARLTTMALALAFVLCLGTLVYANRQKQEAIRQKQEAILRSKEAQDNEALARAERSNFEREKKKAEESAELARKNGRVALDQKDRADEQTELAEQVARKAMIAEERALNLLYASNFNLAQRAYRNKDFARGDELLTTSNPKDRGFEWYHLWNRNHNAEHTIVGYERSLTSVAFSPTKKSLLATGSADGTVALVDSILGKTELLNTRASSVWGSIFSPDGNKLAVLGAVLGDSNKVELWDVAGRKSLGTLPRHPDDLQIECIAFWQEGKLAAGHEQGSITVWDLEAPLIRQTLRYPGPPKAAMPDVVALAGSPKGSILASGYEDGVLRIWNPASGEHAEPRFPLADNERRNHGKITAVAVSPDGKLLAVTTETGWLSIWVTGDIFRAGDFNEGQKQEEPLFEKELILKGLNEKELLLKGLSCLAFSKDGKDLATAGADGTVVFWDMQKLRVTRSELDRLEQARPSAKAGPELMVLEEQIEKLKTEAKGNIELRADTVQVEHSGPITCIAFSGDGRTFASGSSDRTVKVWRLGNGKNQERGVISPDGRLVATVATDAITVLETGKVINSFPIDPNLEVSSMVFSPDSKAIVAGLNDDTVKLYHAKAGEIELSKGTQEVSSNARFIADRDGDVVRVWDTSRGEVLHQFLPRAGFKLQSQAFSPDSKEVAVSYNDGSAKLYYLEMGEEFEIAKMGGGGQRVFFDRDGRFLKLISRGRRSAQARTEAEGISRTWNVKERRLASKDELDSVSKFETPEPALTVRSPSGDKIASAQDESITLTDVSTKHTITKMKVHLGQVTALAFSADGKSLASGGLDGTVMLWDGKSLEHRFDIAALKKPNGTLNRVLNLAFSKDGRRLAIATDSDSKRLAMGTDTAEGTLAIWDLLAKQVLLRLPKTTLSPSPAFSTDNMALGSHTLGRILLGARETDRVTSLSPRKTTRAAPFTWMSSRDEVATPRNSLIAGYSSNTKENVFLHVCRLRYEDNVYVGSTSGGDCHIGDVGPQNGQFSFGSYEVLVNADSTSWVGNAEESSKTLSSKLSRIIAGERADGKQVAICRATGNSGIYIGWTVGDECHIMNGPRGLKFEVLHNKKGIESAISASSKRTSH